MAAPAGFHRSGSHLKPIRWQQLQRPPLACESQSGLGGHHRTRRCLEFAHSDMWRDQLLSLLQPEFCLQNRLHVDLKRWQLMSASKITMHSTSPIFRRRQKNCDTIRDLNTYIPTRYTHPRTLFQSALRHFRRRRGSVFREVIRRAVKPGLAYCALLLC